MGSGPTKFRLVRYCCPADYESQPSTVSVVDCIQYQVKKIVFRIWTGKRLRQTQFLSLPELWNRLSIMLAVDCVQYQGEEGIYLDDGVWRRVSI